MEITIELLAAYAEGATSDEESKAVRQYLMEHPEELETIMMTMDDYYDFDVEDEPENLCNTSQTAAPSMANICYNAAAFVPWMAQTEEKTSMPAQANRGRFMDRLNEFLDELEL